ncbi:hypothetical protein ON010_g3674 [Phytophthora cinnamomi]|nr:hypothetical protein ON010_g3674 [Phytophthora cinnamomi]
MQYNVCTLSLKKLVFRVVSIFLHFHFNTRRLDRSPRLIPISHQSASSPIFLLLWPIAWFEHSKERAEARKLTQEEQPAPCHDGAAVRRRAVRLAGRPPRQAEAAEGRRPEVRLLHLCRRRTSALTDWPFVPASQRHWAAAPSRLQVQRQEGRGRRRGARGGHARGQAQAWHARQGQHLRLPRAQGRREGRGQAARRGRGRGVGGAAGQAGEGGEGRDAAAGAPEEARGGHAVLGDARGRQARAVHGDAAAQVRALQRHRHAHHQLEARAALAVPQQQVVALLHGHDRADLLDDAREHGVPDVRAVGVRSRNGK